MNGLTEVEAIATLVGSNQVTLTGAEQVAASLAQSDLIRLAAKQLYTVATAARRRAALDCETRATQPKTTTSPRDATPQRVSTKTVLRTLARGQTLPDEVLDGPALQLRGTGITAGMTWGDLTREHVDRSISVLEAQLAPLQANLAKNRVAQDVFVRAPDAHTLREACAQLRT